MRMPITTNEDEKKRIVKEMHKINIDQYSAKDVKEIDLTIWRAWMGPTEKLKILKDKMSYSEKGQLVYFEDETIPVKHESLWKVELNPDEAGQLFSELAYVAIEEYKNYFGFPTCDDTTDFEVKIIFNDKKSCAIRGEMDFSFEGLGHLAQCIKDIYPKWIAYPDILDPQEDDYD